MIRLETGETIGSYKITEFSARGGFACIYLAEDPKGGKVALKIGDVAGGGRYLTRCLEVTNRRSPDWISPDETPGEAVFFRNDGVRVDFLDLTEIDQLLTCEADLLSNTKSQNLIRVHGTVEHEGRPVVVWTTSAARPCARKFARSRAFASTGSCPSCAPCSGSIRTPSSATTAT